MVARKCLYAKDARGLVRLRGTLHPEKVAFATLDAADFGSPQTRIRLIAGPPALIKILQEMPSSRRVSVREAFASSGLDVPAPYLKNQTRGRDGEPCRRSVEEQVFHAHLMSRAWYLILSRAC